MGRTVLAIAATGAIAWVPTTSKQHMVQPDTQVALTLPKDSSVKMVATCDGVPDNINCDALKAARAMTLSTAQNNEQARRVLLDVGLIYQWRSRLMTTTRWCSSTTATMPD
ncbi:MAG: hypothetical protein WBG41_14420 [Acidimicrobiales bacterium]